MHLKIVLASTFLGLVAAIPGGRPPPSYPPPPPPSPPPPPPPPPPPAPAPPTVSQCNTGNLQCCNSISSASTPSTASLLGLLGIVAQGITAQVGLGCTPITVIGLGQGAACSQQPACCTGNTYSGLVNLGCVPISL